MSRRTSDHQKGFGRPAAGPSNQTDEDNIRECIVDVGEPDEIADLERDFSVLSLDNNADRNTESYSPVARERAEARREDSRNTESYQPDAREGAETRREDLRRRKDNLDKLKRELVRVINMFLARRFPGFNNIYIDNIIEQTMDFIFKLDMHCVWIIYIAKFCFIIGLIFYVYLKIAEIAEFVFMIYNTEFYQPVAREDAEASREDLIRRKDNLEKFKRELVRVINMFLARRFPGFNNIYIDNISEQIMDFMDSIFLNLLGLEF